MSIHPHYAAAILAGTKRVEFRKRRLAPDVATVVIYATRPVGRLVGIFEVLGHDVAPPSELWHRHRTHAGITATGYDAYYAQTRTAVGILVGRVHALRQSRLLSDIPDLTRAPQSFQYLTEDQAAYVRSWLPQMPPDRLSGQHVLRPLLPIPFHAGREAERTSRSRLRRAI